MKTFENKIANPNTNFTVTKSTVNNNNALLSNVLYTEMENFVKKVISEHSDIVYATPRLYKLQILKNAYLDENLSITGQIIKLDTKDLHFSIVVSKLNKSNKETICRATFKFQLKSSVSMAS
ncbi:hypothetical protein SAMN05444411_110119 [Lutibacter oricola]|uniref:Uncharacterized protein n=1 Tax=Lutibacter oricola TaxID=762486 RepID=A0A1H3F666_9FLAO|nr:hypothetical protein [Lutibacter oricola]SDX85848.1 hypothetical protein SAMN05444411_110119 [Lutibacter oricola]